MPKIPLSKFADKLNDVMYILSREFHKSQAAEFFKTKLTLAQFVILDILSRHGESKMSDIARHINVTTAAVTGIVDRLVREGYVLRAHDLKDRRIIKIHLTPSGNKIVGTIIKQRRAMMIKVFSVISEEERERYLEILTNVAKHLKDQDSVAS